MKTIVLLLFVFWPFQSLACIGLSLPVHTFFPEFPAELEGQPLVAHVKILGEGEFTAPPVGLSTVAGRELRSGGLNIGGSNVPVLVTEGIKGATKGEVLKVYLFGGSCALHYNTEVGSDRYIAGALHDGIFIGIWRESDILEISGE
ncbi:MAG: hypothetical protein ABJ370_03765 [Paracoccaceae bacterium]